MSKALFLGVYLSVKKWGKLWIIEVSEGLFVI
jgi:hypothetical protein